MVSLEHQFTQLSQGVQAKDARYTVQDGRIVADSVTGLEYHLCTDKPYEVHHQGKLVLTGREMTQQESALLDTVRRHVYQAWADEQRQKLAGMGNGGYG